MASPPGVGASCRREAKSFGGEGSWINRAKFRSGLIRGAGDPARQPICLIKKLSSNYCAQAQTRLLFR